MSEGAGSYIFPIALLGFLIFIIRGQFGKD